MNPAQALRSGVDQLGLALPAGACTRLMQYLALLEKWNRTYNLTAIRQPLQMVSHHLLDSLAVIPHLPVPAQGRLADVGAGAGLPGIALALARPDWHVTLNDSNQKKCAFMRQAAIELELANVEVHEGRVEDWRPQIKFPVVISRAFAELEQFLSLCGHLASDEGVLAAMVGARPGGVRCRIVELQVPRLDERRHLALCPVGR
jgi:16S rRNA (guanine527-N7)-methyltransferase